MIADRIVNKTKVHKTANGDLLAIFDEMRTFVERARYIVVEILGLAFVVIIFKPSFIRLRYSNDFCIIR